MSYENDPRRTMKIGDFLQIRPADLVTLLAKECWKSNQKTVAEQLGISPQYLSDILRGRREITGEVASKLGFERVVTFVRWGEGEGVE